MTSTSFNVGLTDNTRLSSRVLRPPGGGHTDIFGGDPEPPRGRRLAPSAVVPSQIQEPAKPTNGTVEPVQNGQATEPQPEQPAQPEASVQAEPVQLEAKESPAKPESLAKPESPTKPEVPEQPKIEPPKRVRVPPGGFSSGLW